LALVAEGSGQEVDAEVEPRAGVEQVLHLLVGFVAGDLRVEVERHQPRRAQTEPRRQTADDHLGDQHPHTLTCAAELADVGAQIVSLHEPGQAAAFTERRDVAGDRDGLDHATGPSSTSRRRCWSTSKSGGGHCRLSERRWSSSSWPTTRLRYHLRSDGTTYHGAISVLVRSRTVSYAERYSGQRSRSSMSAGLNFQYLWGLSSRASKRFFCSAALTCS